MGEIEDNRRIASLDVFRGITIFAMILVNNPGSWEHIYGPLKHAEWHGLTPTDLVFPFFLFIVGTAIPLSLARYKSGETEKRGAYLRIVRRSMIIFGLGLLIALVPDFSFSTLRIPGVLQRIAVCYLVCSILYLLLDMRWQIIVAIGLLAGYILIQATAQIPGCEVSGVDFKACNASAYLDRMILGTNHIWSLSKVYDPEGILSTLPAIASTIFGIFAGVRLSSAESKEDKSGVIFVSGALLFGLGIVLSWIQPLNKALWTSSYAVLTAGIAFSVLGVCYWFVDQKGISRWAYPFRVLGVNALALYVGAELFAKLIDAIPIDSIQGLSLKGYLFNSLNTLIGYPKFASFLFALILVSMWFLVLLALYKKKIFIKV